MLVRRGRLCQLRHMWDRKGRYRVLFDPTSCDLTGSGQKRRLANTRRRGKWSWRRVRPPFGGVGACAAEAADVRWMGSGAGGLGKHRLGETSSTLHNTGWSG